MSFSVGKRRCTLGIAREKLFGKAKKRYPRLSKMIERGTLLSIDIAYGETQVPDGTEREIAQHAALLMLLRKGHLALRKELIEDPELAALIDGEMTLPKIETFEREIASNVKRILSSKCKEISFPFSAQLTEEQQHALLSTGNPLSLITGGPGTGKTHTATEIARAWNTTTVLTAPTGKAASHLEEKIQIPARCATLHALLGVKSPLDYAKKVDPIEEELILVDECSMIDPPLFARLLQAIGPHSHLVLMGDIHQLPAVEGGSIFADLLESEKIPMTKLTKCMRSDRKEILQLAEEVLQGTSRDLRTLDLGFAQNDLQLIYQNLWEYVKNRDFSSFRILSTLRKGPLGVDALNRFFYDQFSKSVDRFPIMITRNDSLTGLANGDMGTLISEKEAVFKNQTIPACDLPPYTYAYCLSVHKSQGSEYDDVLFLVPDGSESFGKEVIYTAVTRARHSISIDGNPQQMAKALSRSSRKHSNLVSKLQ